MRKFALLALALSSAAGLPTATFGNPLRDNDSVVSRHETAGSDYVDSGYYVWYFVYGRWHGDGPYNSYDAYQVLIQYQNQGYRAYIGGPNG